jgi:hypothetical protein
MRANYRFDRAEAEPRRCEFEGECDAHPRVVRPATGPATGDLRRCRSRRKRHRRISSQEPVQARDLVSRTRSLPESERADFAGPSAPGRPASRMGPVGTTGNSAFTSTTSHPTYWGLGDRDRIRCLDRRLCRVGDIGEHQVSARRRQERDEDKLAHTAQRRYGVDVCSALSGQPPLATGLGMATDSPDRRANDSCCQPSRPRVGCRGTTLDRCSLCLLTFVHPDRHA